MKLEYILNIFSCTYVKNYFIFKLNFSSSTYFVHFIMLSTKSILNHFSASNVYYLDKHRPLHRIDSM